MREFGLFVIALSVWFVMIRWVLPYFGIATCCAGGACRVERPAADEAAPGISQSTEDLR